MDNMMSGIEQPGESTPVQVPSYLATLPSPPPCREGDRVSAFANDLFLGWILGGASPPDTDLSVLPIVPPVEPDWPSAILSLTTSIENPQVKIQVTNLPMPILPD